MQSKWALGQSSGDRAAGLLYYGLKTENFKSGRDNELYFVSKVDTKNPDRGPLLIIEGARNRTLDWTRHLAANRNRTSAYHIFPTLLTLMHYDPRDVAAHYGEPLHVPTNDPFTFNKDYYVLFGREPTWEPIDLARMARAPISDYAPALAATAGGCEVEKRNGRAR